MDNESRIHILIQNLRSSRKTTSTSVAAAALVIILIFSVACSYFLLSHFEKLHELYYAAVFRDVFSFQRSLIGADTYAEDMKHIAQAIQTHRGVTHVWFTDRYGKLIYHTDDVMLGEYRTRRLPTDFYESIERSWEYEGQFPVMHSVLLKDKLNLRLSQPLYIVSRDNHDFVMGLDVKRFLFMPYRMFHLLLYAAAFVVISFLLLFLPVFFLIRWRLREAESQARMLRLQGISSAAQGAGIQGDAAHRAAAQDLTAEAMPEQSEVETAPPTPVHEEEVQEEAQIPTAAPEPPEPAEKAAEAAAPNIMSKEIEQDKLLITFLKQKRALFADHDVETEFLQAHSYSLHSKGWEGSYILYQGLNEKHILVCFTAPAGKTPEIYDRIVEIAEMIRLSLKSDTTASKLMRSYNSYSRKEKTSFNISLLLINESKQSVEYVCSGSQTAYYLKDGEKKAKELKLENPELGSLPTKEFGQQLSLADIKLVKNDLFSLPAHNTASITLGESALNLLLQQELVTQRKLSASEIGGTILKQFESLDLTVKNMLPQSGYIIVKFL
jgi:hypothetical protein